MEGFRVRVNLSRYFVDERAHVLLWVQPKGAEASNLATIGHLERKLRRGFGLSDPFCLCLSPDGLLLPSNEPLALLHPDDSLTVIPIGKRFDFEPERPEEEKENATDMVLEKDVKKKKRKKQRELAENLLIDELVEKINAKDTNNKENSPASTPDASLKKKKTATASAASVGVQFATALENIKKIHEEKLKPATDDEADTLKLKAVSMIKDLVQPNVVGVSDGRITKRKRVRIRKNKKNNPAMMGSLSDVESTPPHRNNGVVLLNGNVNSHLRFSLSENMPASVLRNKTQNDDKPRIIQPIEPESDGVESDAEQSNQEIDVKEHSVQQENGWKPNHTVGSFESLPVMNELPKKNNVIVFKMLKMNEQYTPVISNHIVGRVCNVCPDSSLIKFSILDGQSECSLPNGKFDIEEKEPENIDSEMPFDITWNQLIEPRLITQ